MHRGFCFVMLKRNLCPTVWDAHPSFVCLALPLVRQVRDRGRVGTHVRGAALTC